MKAAGSHSVLKACMVNCHCCGWAHFPADNVSMDVCLTEKGPDKEQQPKSHSCYYVSIEVTMKTLKMLVLNVNVNISEVVFNVPERGQCNSCFASLFSFQSFLPRQQK